MLYSSGPNHVLQCAASAVYVELVVTQYFCNQQVVMGLLDVGMLRFLKSIRLRLRRCVFQTAVNSAVPAVRFLKSCAQGNPA